LFSSEAGPALWDYTTLAGGAGVGISPTPMAWISDLFQYWRGDIIFRFRAVKTPFHKGRLRVTYDPQADLSSLSDATTVAYTQFWDLATGPELEIRVPYRQALHWLSTQKMSGGYNWSNNAVNNYHIEGSTNGSISVRVLTQLQAAVTPASLPVQVFVRAAQNFEFAGPQEEFIPTDLLSTFAPQSTAVTMGNTVSGPAPNQYLEYMGEAITSLRQLLRRMVRSYTETTTLTTASGVFAIATHTQSRFPVAAGYDPNGFDTAVSIAGGANAPFNFVPRHPLTWVMAGYVGVRGSMNWNFLYDGTAPGGRISANRNPQTSSANQWGNTVYIASGGNRNAMSRAWAIDDLCGSAGSAVTSQHTQNSLSVKFPMYSQYKFQSASPLYSSGMANPPVDNDGAKQLVSTVVTTPVAKQTWAASILYSWAGIGTDFDLLWFLNAPAVYKYSSYPASA